MYVKNCRSPSQNQDKFDSFSGNFELTLDKLAHNSCIHRINTKSKNCYPLDKTTYQDNQVDTITSPFGLHQLINKPTHKLKNSSSYSDLISTSQHSLVVNSGVHSSVKSLCHL